MRKLAFVFLAIPLITAAPALADDSVTNFSKAVDDSGKAAGHLAESGVQTVAIASVLPVALGASAVVGAGASVVVGAVGGAAAGAVAGADSGAALACSLNPGCFPDDCNCPIHVDRRVFVAPDPAPHAPYAPPPHGTGPAR